MNLQLTKKPKNVTVIEGFPGFGLVGTIASEFLLEHLDFEQIGKVFFDEMPAMVAIHESKLVEPLGVFYNKKHNLVLLHAITASTGLEWKFAEVVCKLVTELKAKEVVSLEGVGSNVESEQSRVFFYATHKAQQAQFKKLKVKPLEEGIIIGVTGAVLLRLDIPVSCIFAETHSNLPDSKAAAKIVEILAKHIGLKIDTKPLVEQAVKFEEKLKGLLTESQRAQEMSDKKKLSYMG